MPVHERFARSSIKKPGNLKNSNYMAGGYDVSSSNAHSAAEAANQNASTVFNFSSPGSWFGGNDQTATPTSSATAATKSPGASGGIDFFPSGQTKTAPSINPLYLLVLALLGFLVLKKI